MNTNTIMESSKATSLATKPASWFWYVRDGWISRTQQPRTTQTQEHYWSKNIPVFISADGTCSTTDQNLLVYNVVGKMNDGTLLPIAILFAQDRDAGKTSRLLCVCVCVIVNYRDIVETHKAIFDFIKQQTRCEIPIIGIDFDAAVRACLLKWFPNTKIVDDQFHANQRINLRYDEMKKVCEARDRTLISTLVCAEGCQTCGQCSEAVS